MSPHQETLEALVDRGIPEFRARLAIDVALQANRVGLEAMHKHCKIIDEPQARTLAMTIAAIFLKTTADRAEQLLPLVLLEAAK